MKTAISLTIPNPQDISSVYAYHRQLGFSGVDHGILHITEPLYHDREALEQYCAAVREACQQTGMEVVQVHGPWPTYDTTEEGLKEGLECFRTAVYACARMGGNKLIIHPVMPFGWDFEEEDADVAEQMTVDRLIALLPDCEKYGVTLCLENMPFLKQRISTMPYIVRAVEKVNSPYVGICLDTGHVNVFQNEDIGQAVRLAAPYLKAIHVHDNYGIPDPHAIPYTGNICWETFVKELAATNYTGTLTLECDVSAKTPEPLYTEHKQYLAHVAQHLADLCESYRK